MGVSNHHKSNWPYRDVSDSEPLNKNDEYVLGPDEQNWQKQKKPDCIIARPLSVNDPLSAHSTRSVGRGEKRTSVRRT